jgi:hypothetical protein
MLLKEKGRSRDGLPDSWAQNKSRRLDGSFRYRPETEFFAELFDPPKEVVACPTGSF